MLYYFCVGSSVAGKLQGLLYNKVQTHAFPGDAFVSRHTHCLISYHSAFTPLCLLPRDLVTSCLNLPFLAYIKKCKPCGEITDLSGDDNEVDVEFVSVAPPPKMARQLYTLSEQMLANRNATEEQRRLVKAALRALRVSREVTVYTFLMEGFATAITNPDSFPSAKKTRARSFPKGISSCAASGSR